MDMALDDIIKNNRTYGQRSQRGRGRGQRGNRGGSGVGAFRRVRNNNTRAAPYRNQRREEPMVDDDIVWEHDLYEDEEEEEEVVEEQPQRGGRIKAVETGTKVKISNLDYNVSEENIQDLFETVGAVKKVSIKYDRSGRSEGEGEVVFSRRADAQAALRKFQGTQVDGKAIRLTILGSNLVVEDKPVRAVAAPRGGGGRRGRGNVVATTFSVSTRGARRLRIGGNRGGLRRGGRRGRMEVD